MIHFELNKTIKKYYLYNKSLSYYFYESLNDFIVKVCKVDFLKTRKDLQTSCFTQKFTDKFPFIIDKVGTLLLFGDSIPSWKINVGVPEPNSFFIQSILMEMIHMESFGPREL